MKLNSISLYTLQIPFKQAFAHHNARREKTESVWVELHSDSGLIGYGEACPRPYVSGESIGSIQAFFQTWAPTWLEQLDSLASLLHWGIEQETFIQAQPAAWCAFELAFLDLLAQEKQVSVEALLGLAELSDTFTYTAVLGLGAWEVFLDQAQRYLDWGFQNFKLKLSGELAQDFRRINYLLEARGSVRVDANNLWESTAEVLTYFKTLDFPLQGIEEPLSPAKQYTALAELGTELKLPIILDESCLGVKDLEALKPSPDWIVNLRISKLGGILRSLATAQKAKDQGIPLIVGAQVGETSLLTRAALTLVQTFKSEIVAQEGAFGTHLLEEELARPALMFGQAGALAAPLPLFGWGMVPYQSRQDLLVLLQKFML